MSDWILTDLNNTGVSHMFNFIEWTTLIAICRNVQGGSKNREYFESL